MTPGPEGTPGEKEGIRLSEVSAGRDINILLQGIRALPTEYAVRIQNFLTEYLDSSGHPVPFGGRKAGLCFRVDYSAMTVG